jgi:hypothetical protein
VNVTFGTPHSAVAVTATDETGLGMTSGTARTWVAPGALGSLTIPNLPSQTTAGNKMTFTVVARDLFGTLAYNDTGTVDLTSTDPMATFYDPSSASPSTPITSYTFTPSDAGKHILAVVLDKAGWPSVTVTDQATGVTESTGSHVLSGAAHAIVINGLPSTVQAGRAYTFVISVKDAKGNLAKGYTGTVAMSSDDAAAIFTPQTITFTTSDLAQTTVTVTFNTKVKHRLTVADENDGTLTDSLLGINVI